MSSFSQPETYTGYTTTEIVKQKGQLTRQTQIVDKEVNLAIKAADRQINSDLNIAVNDDGSNTVNYPDCDPRLTMISTFLSLCNLKIEGEDKTRNYERFCEEAQKALTKYKENMDDVVDSQYGEYAGSDYVTEPLNPEATPYKTFVRKTSDTSAYFNL